MKNTSIHQSIRPVGLLRVAARSASLLALALSGAGQAFANDECGAEAAGADTVVCTGAVYPGGIVYTDSDGLTLALDNSSMAVGNYVGVYSSFTNVNDMTINVRNASSIAGPIIAQNNGTAGAVSVTLSNSAVTTGAYGLYANNTNAANTANATATMTGGSITTSGSFAYGVWANNAVSAGDTFAKISGGTISTTGFGSSGGLSLSRAGGHANIHMSAGAITAVGDQSHGIMATSANATGGASALMEGGSINTAGASAAGVHVIGGLGSSAAQMTGGSVVTTGVNAEGIVANTQGTNTQAVVRLDGGSVHTGGDRSDGVYSRALGSANGEANATILMTGGDVSTEGVVAHGIWGHSQSPGDVRVEATGGSVATSGNGSHAVYALNEFGAGDNQVLVGPNATVSASGAIADGVNATNRNVGGGNAVQINGVVTGGSAGAAGVRTGSAIGALSDIVISDGANVSAASGIALVNNAGNSNTLIQGSAIVAGEIRLDLGTDNLIFDGADFSQVTRMDGGDDVSGVDGWVDTVTFRNVSGSYAGANVDNWENVVLDAAAFSFTDGQLVTGSESGTGLFLTNGSTLDGLNAFALTGNMSVGAGSTFVATGGGAGVYSVSANLANAGTVALQDGATGDVVTVGGDYIGTPGSRLMLDTRLGADNSPTDRIIVNGNLSGSSTIVVTNVGGVGALTAGDGIKLVQVDGTSAPGGLTLSGGAIDAGAYRYGLYLGGLANPGDQDWYLRSRARDIVAPTVSLARVSQEIGLASLGTLHERVGEQEHDGLQAREGGLLRGVWGRLLGQDYSDTAKSAEFGNMRTNGQFGGAQLGVDLYRSATTDGKHTHVGVYGGHFWSGTRDYQVTPQRLYSGTTRSDGWTAGLYATHYGAGWYADAVVQRSWLDHKASATDGTTLKTESDSWHASLELGAPLALGSDFKFEPQAQLIYGNVSLDDVQDSVGIPNRFDVENSLTGRLGFRLKRTWDYDASNDGGLFTAYLKANIWATLDGGKTKLAVGNSLPGSVQYRERWGDVGFGTTFSLMKNADFFFDGDVTFGIDQGTTALAGHTGVRIRW